ncbi:type II secretion system protein GspD [beta proteobacterium AAP121]|nr:type II secretion system protein GspD [beta proteobacterium AAP65]KPF97794.1 type II secretion system protein GspD [beta proteobacterium AAP121]
MSMNLRHLGRCALALALLAQLPASAQDLPTRSRAPVTVNFVNADIEGVTRAFAAMIGRAIVVDPRVKGTITVYSEQPQTIRQAWQSYQSALRGLGFAVVESGGLLKVVPEADAKLQTGTVSIGEVGVKGDQVITQIFSLRHENPNNLVPILRPLISANNTINANPASNSLVITDYAGNLERIGRIIAALDLPSSTGVEVVPLQHAVAADLAPLVQRLSDAATTAVPGVPNAGGGTTVVADSRANALLVKAANPARLAQVRATIAQLDRPSTLLGPGGGMWVVHLKNAEATRLATVIRAAFGAFGGGASGSAAAGTGGTAAPSAGAATTGGAAGAAGAGGTGGGAVTAAAQPSTGGFIQADPATNSLIITAPEPLYKQVRALIDQLDTRRAQVYIESMIVEVAGGDAADFGFQWQGLLGQSGDRTGLAGGTNFTPAGGVGNIISVNTGAVQGQINLGQGLNVGLLRAYNGVTSLAAIARMLQSQAQTNIVSTPTLITLDNEEAKIVVGENVPFITGQFTGVGGTSGATTNPFQTIERKDVGITLRIRPQIGEGGAVRMTIFQEQSSVKQDTAAGTTNAGPSTTKRSYEGAVVVDDGEILVLGGLIEDRFITNQSKVPLLGDIPWLGALFRSESRERRRTNLMVFLRPIVMRDAESANRFSADRYEQMRGQQQNAQPAPSVVMPINESPVLPARPSASQPLGSTPASAPAPAPAQRP